MMEEQGPVKDRYLSAKPRVITFRREWCSLAGEPKIFQELSFSEKNQNLSSQF